MRDIPTIAGLVIVIALVLSKTRGQVLRPWRRLIWPIVILVLGAVMIALQAPHPLALHAVDAVVVALDLTLSIVLGVARGLTIRLYVDGGASCYRFGPATVALWGLSIALRAALGLYGAEHGALPVVAGGSVLFMLGLSLLAQNAFVLVRAVRGPAARPVPAPSIDGPKEGILP